MEALLATMESAKASNKAPTAARSEEHTSELQSRSDLVCRLLLEKKKKRRQPTCQHANSEQHSDPHADGQRRAQRCTQRAYTRPRRICSAAARHDPQSSTR